MKLKGRPTDAKQSCRTLCLYQERPEKGIQGGEHMPAIATLEELKAVDMALRKLKEEHPEA